MTEGRLGVACKFLNNDGTEHAWHFRDLSRLTYRNRGDTYLHEIAFHNVRVLNEIVCTMARGPERDRMFRMGNGILPCLSLPEAQRAWSDVGFVRDLSNAYASVGRRARDGGVRLSTHPDQFIVPNSVHAEVRKRSVFELDRWGMWVERMGLGPVQGFCMNIHVGPTHDHDMKTLIQSWRTAKREMSSAAWRALTIENTDKVWSAWETIEACGAVGARPVVDMHHHWCVSGKWLDPTTLAKHVVPLWPASRPKVHVSIPRLDECGGRSTLGRNGMPLHRKCTKNARPHAQLPWTSGLASYVTQLLAWSDGIVEIKMKNLARSALWRAIDAEHA